MFNKQQLIERQELVDRVLLGLRESPAVVLLGARQVGKTTLARMVASSFHDVSRYDLESRSGRAALESTPELTLRDASGLVVIDEIQRLPELFSTLRPLLDDPSHSASFLLLGSASPDVVRGVSESLAGRAQFASVGGFSLDEVGPEAQDRLWIRGGFPRAFLANSDDAAGRWMEGFRRTFLERDLPLTGNSVAPAAMGRFWTMLAHYHGQHWNASEMARSLGSSPGTALRYRDLLEGTFMVRVLQPWFENVRKRQRKAPKIYMRDSGVLHHFLGLNSMQGLRAHPRYGASWEGFALEQVLARWGDRDAYFWGTQRGAELDLLLFREGKRWGFEFKCADAPSTSRSMHIAREDLELSHLWVVYPGTTRYPLADGITALPAREIPSLVLAD